MTHQDLEVMKSTFSDYLDQSLITPPKSAKELSDAVSGHIKRAGYLGSIEDHKTAWEQLLRKAVLELAADDSTATKDSNPEYYNRLRSRLDLVLEFERQGAIHPSVPITVICDLLDTQTVSSCTHVFAYLQKHANQIPIKKQDQTTFLRCCNDLLRRVSKTTRSGTDDGYDGAVFCGKILCFLSQTFDLHDRSGVNLKGELGPAWDGPGADVYDPAVSKPSAEVPPSEDEATSDMLSVEEKENNSRKQALYNTFWSLQTIFAQPNLLTRPPNNKNEKLQTFFADVEKVMPILKDANNRDREGTRTTASTQDTSSLKRKRDVLDTESAQPPIEERKSVDYFFAKYLTSPDLLDLELADPLFRRQFLTQLLILCTHLLRFTPNAKKTWSSTNRALIPDTLVLETEDESSCISFVSECYRELRATYPRGAAVCETVKTIIEREQNWVLWKNKSCPNFSRPPAYFELVDGKFVQHPSKEASNDKDQPPPVVVTMEEATKVFRTSAEDLPPFPHKWGTNKLTEIWEMGYAGPWSLEGSAPQPRELDFFLQQARKTEIKRQTRQKTLNGLRAARIQALERQKQDAAEAAAKEKAEADGKMDVDKNLEVPSSSTPLTAPASAAPSPAPPTRETSSPLPPTKPALSADAPEFKPSNSVVLGAKIIPKRPPMDKELAKYVETQDRTTWLGLRATRFTHLKYFSTNGTGDLEQLFKDASNPNWGVPPPKKDETSADAEVNKPVEDEQNKTEDVQMGSTEETVVELEQPQPKDGEMTEPGPTSLAEDVPVDVTTGGNVEPDKEPDTTGGDDGTGVEGSVEEEEESALAESGLTTPGFHTDSEGFIHASVPPSPEPEAGMDVDQ
ncbi:THO complex subunit 1 transcription elongation factor-domain-containing protein [Flagelloscypha sp. PMI_526]|nr:THO complex subunit 1 transcription elongation factor-domain-containing protein [Flagelloscypha sp. PMI_526]